MGGEMIFIHNNKPIEDLEAYRKLLREIAIDCTTLRRRHRALQIQIIETPISNWEDGYMTKRYNPGKYGQDDDYELSIDLGGYCGGFPVTPYKHYHVIFPKDPNKLKVLSDLHARGMNDYNKDWIHDYLLKFVVTFPGVFKLYYGDGFGGYSSYQLIYRDGSAVPVRGTGDMLQFICVE